jgi:serine/threonine protein kinase
MFSVVGGQLGRYQILEEIGRGGMAVVYKAYQPSLNRYVALKVLPAQYQNDAELLARFRREAEAAKALAHPNIVRVFEVGEAQGMPFIAMEYVEGGSVASELSRRHGPLDTGTATGIAAQIAAALDYAHQQGVIHRDVKPSNMLLARDGRALLSDFGIAKAAGKRTLTQKGTLLGTPAYMSPEQARGRRNIDGRSDIYSLGVVLYEMLTGDVPFRGDDPTVILRAVLDDAPAPPSWLYPAIPPAVERIVLRALAKEPEKRYATAGEMLAALQAATPGRPIPVRPTVIAPSPAKPAVRPSARPVPAPVLLAIAVLAVALLAMVLQPPQPVQPTPTRTPTLAPTVTTSGEGLPTATPVSGPTATPIPTETPKPTHEPTAIPARAPQPILVSPTSGANVGGESVRLEWTGTLRKDRNEWFDVRLWQDGQDPKGVAWTQDTYYDCRPPKGGKWNWAIAVMQLTGMNPDGSKYGPQVSDQSTVWWFAYSPSQPPPTNAPLPAPTITAKPED